MTFSIFCGNIIVPSTTRGQYAQSSRHATALCNLCVTYARVGGLLWTFIRPALSALDEYIIHLIWMEVDTLFHFLDFSRETVMRNTNYEYMKKCRDKSYKRTEVLISINDHTIIKRYCDENDISIGNYIYTTVIKDMAARGIRLEGTATRNVDDIINSDVLSAANRTSASDEDCKK